MANNKSTIVVVATSLVMLLALTFNVALSKEGMGTPCIRDPDCLPVCNGYNYALCVSSKCSCVGSKEGRSPSNPAVEKVCNIDAQCKSFCKGHAFAECIGHKCFCSSVGDGVAPAEAPSEEGLKAVGTPVCNRDELCKPFCSVGTYPQCILHKCECTGST